MELPEKIKQLMKNEGLNSVELAHRVGVSKQYISQILTSNQDLRLSTMSKLANALNTTVSALLDETEKPANKSSKTMTKKVIFQIEVDESNNDNYFKMVIGKEFLKQIKK